MPNKSILKSMIIINISNFGNAVLELVITTIYISFLPHIPRANWQSSEPEPLCWRSAKRQV